MLDTVPALNARTAQMRQAEWKLCRHVGEQKRCGLPPVARGGKAMLHNKQGLSRIMNS